MNVLDYSKFIPAPELIANKRMNSICYEDENLTPLAELFEKKIHTVRGASLNLGV